MYIPLPNHLHAEWTRRAAAAGKHVLCEKPLAMDAREAAGMIEACRDAGVALMEAFMYRLHPLWLRAHELVAGGAIGELEAIQASFSYRNVDPANIRNIADYGGGALMDIGCYPINVARWFFGGRARPRRRSRPLRPDVRHRRAGVGDPRVRRAAGHVHLLDPGRGRPAGAPARYRRAVGRADPVQHPARSPDPAVLAAGGDPPVAPDIDIIEVPAADPYGVQGDAFSAAVQAGTPVPIPPDDAVGNLAVIEQILRGRAR